MSTLHNLEKLIKNGCSIYFEEGRYCDSVFAGVDFPLPVGEHYNYYKHNSVFDEIDTANGPGDLDAMNAASKLAGFAEIHPEFLFVTGKTLEDVLKLLDKRAELWNRLSYDEQMGLLDQFILFEDSVL